MKKNIKIPVLIAIIGYIIGILWGIYLKSNICLFYFIIIAIFIIYKFLTSKKEITTKKLKLISIKRYLRYVKLIINSKTLILIILMSIISNIIINTKEQIYENIYKSEKKAEIVCLVIGNKEEKEYYNRYKIKVIESKTNNKFKNKIFYIQIKNKTKTEIKYGDILKINGTYEKPEEKRNYGGFDYKNFLKTKNIYGNIIVENSEKIKQKKNLFYYINEITETIKNKIDESFEQSVATMLEGILLGNTSEIEENIKENFRIANIAHVLAISGMHVNYIIMGFSIIFNKIIGKRQSKIITIFLLIIYAIMVRNSISVFRAIIMGILLIASGLVHRRTDIVTSISISLFLILLYNPYLINNIGIQLSYFGTLGIIFFQKNFIQIFNKFNIKNKIYEKIFKNIKDILAVSLSAQIMILPINIYYFNFVAIYFIIANIFISIVIGPLILLGISFIILSLIYFKYAKLLINILTIGTQILIKISEISKLPCAKIYIQTPKIWQIILYYIFIFIVKYFILLYNTNKNTATQLRVKNLIALIKYKFKINKNKNINIVAMLVCITIIFNFYLFPRKIKIYFVDVGQGDCTFITTPKNKTILIDGGGSELGNYDVGKNVLLPYLLDRGYTKIDLVIISHFDSDHVKGLLTIINELKIKKVIIAKQTEKSKNYEELLKIANEKTINISEVKKGDKIDIEKGIYVDILWPKKDQIETNAMNNNSIVMKFVYNNFSMLFTGDIEEIAEKEIVKLYKNTKKLKSNVIKIAHHGSKTSSSESFLNEVKPQIALIGVGKNNKFGHPNQKTLDNLKNINCVVYRTDECGEIELSRILNLK